MRTLAFCSNCGEELVGVLNYCSKCGYKLDEEEEKILGKKGTSSDRPLSEDRPVKEETGKVNVKANEKVTTDTNIELPKDTATDNDYAGSRRRYQEDPRGPPGTKVKSRVPKSTRCIVCNTKTDDICFFCDYAVCTTHSVKMQVFADKAKFGNIIPSCPDCSKKKTGKEPTKDEAAEIGFFFNIKPYHEWKILD